MALVRWTPSSIATTTNALSTIALSPWGCASWSGRPLGSLAACHNPRVKWDRILRPEFCLICGHPDDQHAGSRLVGPWPHIYRCGICSQDCQTGMPEELWTFSAYHFTSDEGEIETGRP
jgi:hypothetical protein